MKKIIILLLIAFLSGCGREEGNIDKSTVVASDTSLKKENISIGTADGLKLSADYFYKTVKSKQPLVILIHQFRSDKEQWQQSFVDSLIKKGYKVLALDLRSHGKSDPAPVEQIQLLSDPAQAPRDVDAAVAWAKTQTSIDSNRIAIIGTSIGGSLGIYGRINQGIKSVVAVSSGKSTFEAFTGYDDRKMSMARPIPRIKNIMFICGKKDGNYAEEEQAIFDNYLDEPREIQFFESEKHGKFLIEEFPEINKFILNWLNKTL